MSQRLPADILILASSCLQGHPDNTACPKIWLLRLVDCVSRPPTHTHRVPGAWRAAAHLSRQPLRQTLAALSLQQRVVSVSPVHSSLAVWANYFCLKPRQHNTHRGRNRRFTSHLSPFMNCFFSLSDREKQKSLPILRRRRQKHAVFLLTVMLSGTWRGMVFSQNLFFIVFWSGEKMTAHFSTSRNNFSPLYQVKGPFHKTAVQTDVCSRALNLHHGLFITSWGNDVDYRSFMTIITCLMGSLIMHIYMA